MGQIINGLLGVIASILANFLPQNFGFPAEVSNGLQYIIQVANGFGFIIPWGTMWQILVFMFWFEIGMFAFKIITWVIGVAGQVTQGLASAANGTITFLQTVGTFIASFFV